MSTITISDLHPNGFDLFLDSDSYLNELVDEELNMTYGGGTWSIALAATIVSIVTVITGVSVYYAVRDLGQRQEQKLDQQIQAIP